jgi:selenocysteine lyase/cysteine desulfurase
MARVIAALELRLGDEILTSDEEHPGLYGALIAARERHRVRVRCVALEHVADAIGPDTRLVACSHVGWVGGAYAPAELAEAEVPVLLDGAQGVGAVPVDVEALGCAFYAAAGQKWLCGPIGTGLLYVAPHMRARLHPATLGYSNLAEPDRGMAAEAHDDARSLDTAALSPEEAATALAAHDVLAAFGWDDVYERAASLADRLATELRARGIRVEPRGRTTLVAWRDNTPVGTRDRLAAEGVIVRNLPRHALLRASVGAWNDEDDLARLLNAL